MEAELNKAYYFVAYYISSTQQYTSLFFGNFFPSGGIIHGHLNVHSSLDSFIEHGISMRLVLQVGIYLKLSVATGLRSGVWISIIRNGAETKTRDQHVTLD